MRTIFGLDEFSSILRRRFRTCTITVLPEPARYFRSTRPRTAPRQSRCGRGSGADTRGWRTPCRSGRRACRARDLMRREIDLKILHCKRLFRLAAVLLISAHQRADLGQRLHTGEGLGQEIVAAAGIGADAVVLGGLRGEEQDRGRWSPCVSRRRSGSRPSPASSHPAARGQAPDAPSHTRRPPCRLASATVYVSLSNIFSTWRISGSSSTIRILELAAIFISPLYKNDT